MSIILLKMHFVKSMNELMISQSLSILACTQYVNSQLGHMTDLLLLASELLFAL